MRYSAIKSYPYSADVYDVEFDSEGVPIRETLRTNMRLSLDSGGTGSINIDSVDSLGVDVIIRNIKDRNGKMLYPEEAVGSGAAYVIWQEAPILSAVGTIEGYTSKARKR